MHRDAAALAATRPAAHALHAVASARSLNAPAAHGRQDAALGAPTVVEYRPRPQAVHCWAPSSEYLPAGQVEQTVLASLDEYWPAVHGTQASLELAPDVLLALPGAHALH